MDPARFPVFLDRFRGCLRSFPPLLLQSGATWPFLPHLLHSILDLISFALFPVAFFCFSMYAWVAGFAFPDDALESVVLPESIDESSETYPIPLCQIKLNRQYFPLN